MRQWLGQLRRAIVRVVRYLMSAALRALLLVALPVAAFMIANSIWGLESGIRLGGGSAQIVGLATTILGLNATSKLFNEPGPIGRVLRWFSGIPLRRRAVRLEAHGGIFTVTAGSLSARLGVPKQGTIKKRLDVLERNVSAMDEEFRQHGKRQEARERIVEQALAAQKGDIHQVETRLAGRLEAAIAGGLTLEWVGVCFFVVGIIASSASVEIAKCLGV